MSNAGKTCKISKQPGHSIQKPSDLDRWLCLYFRAIERNRFWIGWSKWVDTLWEPEAEESHMLSLVITGIVLWWDQKGIWAAGQTYSENEKLSKYATRHANACTHIARLTKICSESTTIHFDQCRMIEPKNALRISLIRFWLQKIKHFLIGE